MHIQTIESARDTVACPHCHTLQNVDVIWNDEERDLLSGQRCWYCGREIDANDLTGGSLFQVVVSSAEVPSSAAELAAWTGAMESRFGGKLVGYTIDDAGRCLVAMDKNRGMPDEL